MYRGEYFILFFIIIDKQGAVSTVKNGMERDKNTFVVKILNQQNATWQGSVMWMEEQKVQKFRSALELLKLISGALEENSEAEGGSHEK